MNPLHILLVDDSKADLLMIEMALNESGITHQIDAISDGGKAIAFLKTQVEKNAIPDLILLDINMPKMNGHEVLDIVKQDEQLKHIPIIMLSTSAARTDVLKSYQKYANCYIVKPGTFSDFGKVVSSLENFWMNTVKLPNNDAV